ncbi:outer membrane protein assembly factor BamB family protein [Paenibacillus aceti]|uniref:outer membrane protein assembly factor BamB family protein n=1 Tax=Paenibacillus aceti TaxID=1820010 RepID=UPI0013C53717|nr:PQQ-binding-like beta-propeller repeat protein [Paenibacillus aceti]
MIQLSRLAAGMVLCSILLLPSPATVLGTDADHTGINLRTAAPDLSSNILPRKGDSLEAKQRIPLFPEQITAQSDIYKFNVSSYGQLGDRFTVRDRKGELLQLHSEDLGNVWTPLWYWSKDAVLMEPPNEPRLVTLTDRAKLVLAPNSSIAWDNRKDASVWVAVAQWKSWAGVLVGPEPWQQDGEIYQPILLWVQKQDIASEEPLPPSGLFAQDSRISTDRFRSMTSGLLVPGMDRASVQKLLGAPLFTEISENLQMIDGQPMQLGETWRYERSDGHFLVSFSDEGKLERTSWIFSGTGQAQTIYSGAESRFSYKFLNTPLPKTLPLKQVWRQQGDLDFAYLLAATPRELLVLGDDGGFSGMHHNSHLYAISRADGRKLWQVEAGFGTLQVEVAESGDRVTVLTDYNPQAKRYENRLQQIRLSDGKILWGLVPEEDVRMGMWLARHSVILLSSPDSVTQKPATTELSVLDHNTGKLKWKRKVAPEARVLNEGGADPYVLVRDDEALKAYDPESGQVMWSVKLQGKLSGPIDYDIYYPGGIRSGPFAEPDPDRWFLLGDRWVRLNMQTGSSLAEYPAVPGEPFEVIDGRYLLVQRLMRPKVSGDRLQSGETAGNRLIPDYEKNNPQYESVLYDTERRTELWSISGKAAKGVIAGDMLYLLRDGAPTAIELKSGRLIWKMKETADVPENMDSCAGGGYIVLRDDLLLPYGANLLVIDRSNGSLLGRIPDLLMGYAELREDVSRKGTMNRSGDELYVGTANGAMVRFSIRELEQELAP